MLSFHSLFLFGACTLRTVFCSSYPLLVDANVEHLDTRAFQPGHSCILKAELHDKVLFPQEPAYHNLRSGARGYWSQQAASLSPACRVLATNADDVSLAVQTLVARHCVFAVRSGGHMSWAGAADIQNGVTIDLSAMQNITVSSNCRITSIGPGARWEDVYLRLDSVGLAVAGGRVAEVGVGGLLTGGGNSFFAAQYGFACDNVENFQVVLASGKIVNANINKNLGLFKALKGGSNNFGIVTRFDLKTFPQGKLWGGFVMNSINSSAEQFQYLQDFTAASGNGADPHASIINSYILTGQGPAIIANQFTYTRPTPFPSIFANFTRIPQLTPNTLRTTNLTDLTIELGVGTPNGLRQLFGTATFANNATLFAELFRLATEHFKPVQNATGFQASFVLQPISKAITSKGALNGGNSLGIGAKDGDLVWLDLTLQWTNSTADAAITAATRTLLAQCLAYASAHDLAHRFQYLNYALQSQDPIASYGPQSVAHLRSMSRLYDPGRVFQRLVPGGFKLWR